MQRAAPRLRERGAHLGPVGFCREAGTRAGARRGQRPGCRAVAPSQAPRPAGWPPGTDGPSGARGAGRLLRQRSSTRSPGNREERGGRRPAAGSGSGGSAAQLRRPDVSKQRGGRRRPGLGGGERGQEGRRAGGQARGRHSTGRLAPRGSLRRPGRGEQPALRGPPKGIGTDARRGRLQAAAATFIGDVPGWSNATTWALLGLRAGNTGPRGNDRDGGAGGLEGRHGGDFCPGTRMLPSSQHLLGRAQNPPSPQRRPGLQPVHRLLQGNPGQGREVGGRGVHTSRPRALTLRLPHCGP